MHSRRRLRLPGFTGWPTLVLPLLLALVGFGCGDDTVVPAGEEGGASSGVFSANVREGADFEVEAAVTDHTGAVIPGPFIIRGTDLHYDGDLEALVVDLTVTNRSNRTFSEPVTLTFVTLLPEGVTVQNADNDSTGAGAMFVFPFEGEDEEWEPGEESLPRTVQFGVDQGVAVAFVARVDVGMDPTLGSIGGRVWLDENEDGIIDDDEEGLGGVMVVVFGGDIERVAESHRDGTYRVDRLPAGTYTVRKLPNPRVEPTTPTQYIVLLAETDDGVSSFLTANFGCVPRDEGEFPPVEIGDYVRVKGSYLADRELILARHVELWHDHDDDEGEGDDDGHHEGDHHGDHGGNHEGRDGDDDDWPEGRAELRGPVTDVAREDHAIQVMGTWIVFEEGFEDQAQTECRFPDEVEVGTRVRVVVDQVEPGDRPLEGLRIKCWEGDWDGVTGRIEDIRIAEEAEIIGLQVVRTQCLITRDTVWDD